MSYYTIQIKTHAIQTPKTGIKLDGTIKECWKNWMQCLKFERECTSRNGERLPMDSSGIVNACNFAKSLGIGADQLEIFEVSQELDGDSFDWVSEPVDVWEFYSED